MKKNLQAVSNFCIKCQTNRFHMTDCDCSCHEMKFEPKRIPLTPKVSPEREREIMKEYREAMEKSEPLRLKIYNLLLLNRISGDELDFEGATDEILALVEEELKDHLRVNKTLEKRLRTAKAEAKRELVEKILDKKLTYAVGSEAWLVIDNLIIELERSQ